LYDRRCLHTCLSSQFREGYHTVAEPKMLLTIVSTDKCKIQELHFEKTLTNIAINLKNKNPSPILSSTFMSFKQRRYTKSHFHFFFEQYSDTVLTLLLHDSISICISCSTRMICLTKKTSISLTIFTYGYTDIIL